MSDYPTVRPRLVLDFANSKKLDRRITFRRSSTGTYVGADGLIKTANIDQPRFDHDPTTGKSLGLLVEESRTNNLTFSGALSSLGISNAIRTFNALIAPDGTLTATKITENNQNGRHFVNGSGHLANSTRSVYAKAGERRRIFLSDSNISAATFDLITGSVVYSANCTATITNAGNGWFRCSISHTSFTSEAWFGLNTESGTSYQIYQGDGVSGAYFWGAQVEAGSFPTSYIPTAGATVTRSADVASMTGTNFSSWYNKEQGTYFAQTNNVNVTYGAGIFATYASGSQRDVFFAETNTNMQWYQDPPTNSVSMPVPPGFDLSTQIAGAYVSNGTRSLAVGKASIKSNSSGSRGNVDLITIGHRNSVNWINGRISCIAYWPKRLPDSQLIALTRR